MIEFLKSPWPWYVAGPLIGLIVPTLLILGNKPFGISSTLRHVCAAVLPARIPYFSYNWRQESWNLFFVAGIVIGAALAALLLGNPEPVTLNPQTISDLKALGVQDFSGLLPLDLFSIEYIWSLKNLFFWVFGGFVVGFGTRYAGGCTSGHSITGLATLQLPSLIATIAFMVGGFACTHLLLPLIFKIIA